MRYVRKCNRQLFIYYCDLSATKYKMRFIVVPLLAKPKNEQIDIFSVVLLRLWNDKMHFLAYAAVGAITVRTER